jgi:serine/threonine-protein kinase
LLRATTCGILGFDQRDPFEARDAMVPGANDPTDSGRGDELEALLRDELAPELELVKRIGRGSMASVYLAREPELGRLIAVKALSPDLADDERARARFEREGRSVAALSHPNIVPIHRVGRLSNGLPYLVMQFVKGQTIADRLQAEGELPIAEARRVLTEVAAALAAAHQKGIVHRDVRGGNILYEEETGRAMLTDFGIAAVMASGDTGESARLTRTGELVGKPKYMSPELLMGGRITERSDVYSLGLLGYELLAGRSPYDSNSQREMIAAHIRQSPRKLSELRDGVDRDLQQLLERCLAKDPDHRPSAADAARRLSESAATPAHGTQISKGLASDLLERHLPQIVVITAAGAWAILEIVNQLVERTILPLIAYQLALVAVVTAIPAVLVGSWFHGKKGHQKLSRIEYWVFAALALVWLAVSTAILIAWLK